MGRKLGLCPFLGWAGSHPTQRRLGRGLPPYQVASWSIQPFGHNRHGPKIGWGLCPFFWGKLGPHTKSPGLRPTPYQVESYSIQPFGHNGDGPKIGGCASLGEGELGSYLTQCRLGSRLPPYQVVSWCIQPFGHNRHAPKMGGCAPFWEELDPHLAQCDNVAWAEADLHTKWHLDASSRLATIEMGRNWGCSAPFLGRGAGSPSRTMWPGSRPTSYPSAIL